MDFYNEPLEQIFTTIEKQLLLSDEVSFNILNPDLYNIYVGTSIVIEAKEYIYRPLKAWIDLAELLKCKMLLPQPIKYPLVQITLKKLQRENSFHSNIKKLPQNEKYGSNSIFSNIYKMEEPAFYYYYKEALKNVKIQEKQHILNLGVNRADEFEVIKNLVDIDNFKQKTLVGIDFSTSAIKEASLKFKKDKNVVFYESDINAIDTLSLGEFDLLISIGTLQSTTLNFKPFFMSLVQNYLHKKNSAIILGFPNSRWMGGELIYGAKAPHYAMSEMGLVLSDMMFCKKYLQQHHYRVTITGKYYLFLVGTKLKKP